MNSSRLVAGIAALAIGFGVTLVGVVASDDSTEVVAGVDSETDDEVDDEVDGPVDDNPDVVGDVGGEPDDSSEAGDDAARQEESEADVPEDAEVSEPGGPASEPRDPPDELPSGTIPEQPSTTQSNEPDVAVPEDVQCVDTISVVFDDGAIIDFVVIEREGDFTWLVLDADGTFLISRDDPDVARVVEVQREVRFFQGAPVDFFDVCDDASSSSAELEQDVELGAGRSSLDFPCSDGARVAQNERLDSADIEALDDVGEFVLAVSIELDDLGRRTTESWFDQLIVEVDAFMAFDDGCSAAIEEEFRRGNLLCAAGKISADGRLLEQLRTAAPGALAICPLELDQDGDI